MQDWTVSTYRDLHSVQLIWEDLYHTTPAVSPFMAWEYVTLWWRHFGRPYSPFILVAQKRTDPGRRVIVPLMRHGADLKWLTAPGPDSVNILRRCDEDLPDGTKAIANYLAGMRWAKVSLWYLPEQEGEHLMRALGHYPNRIDKNSGSPYIPINGQSWQDFQMSLSHSRRRDMKDVVLRMQKAGIQHHYEIARDPEKICELFPVMQALTISAGTQDKIELVTGSQADYLLDLCCTFAARGWLTLSVLYLNEQPSAYSIYFTMNHVTGYWRTAYDPKLQVYSSGKLMLFNLLHESFERRDTTFDFMHGLEKY